MGLEEKKASFLWHTGPKLTRSVWVPAVHLFLGDMREADDDFLFFVLVAGKAEKLVT